MNATLKSLLTPFALVDLVAVYCWTQVRLACTRDFGRRITLLNSLEAKIDECEARWVK